MSRSGKGAEQVRAKSVDGEEEARGGKVKRVRHGETSIEVERPKVESVRSDEEDEAPQEEVEDVPRWPRLTRDEAMEYKGCDEDGRVASRREKKE